MRRRLRNLRLHEIYDLFFLCVLALLLPLLSVLPLPFVRVPLGLIMVLLAPGYVLAAALFPQRGDLDAPARAALSFGLSVAALPVLALLLDILPWGLRPWPIVIALAITVIGLSVVAALRRASQESASTAYVPPSLYLPRASTFVFAVSVALVVAALLYFGVSTMVAANQPARLTEFYALGAGGLVEDYPREVLVGQDVGVRIGIANHEGAAEQYRIEVRIGAHLLSTPGPIALADGASWEQPIDFRLPAAGDDQPIDILLFRDKQAAPYRQLRLWVNVRGTQP